MKSPAILLARELPKMRANQILSTYNGWPSSFSVGLRERSLKCFVESVRRSAMVNNRWRGENPKPAVLNPLFGTDSLHRCATHLKSRWKRTVESAILLLEKSTQQSYFLSGTNIIPGSCKWSERGLPHNCNTT